MTLIYLHAAGYMSPNIDTRLEMNFGVKIENLSFYLSIKITMDDSKNLEEKK